MNGWMNERTSPSGSGGGDDDDDDDDDDDEGGGGGDGSGGRWGMVLGIPPPPYSTLPLFSLKKGKKKNLGLFVTIYTTLK